MIISVATLAIGFLCCDKNKSVDIAETLNNNPEIIINAMQNYEVKMRETAAAEAQKKVSDNLEAIISNPNSPSLGNKDGSVVIVEFFDFACGYCHRLYPTIKEIIAKNPEVKVISRELAFVSPSSSYAAKASIAANMQGK